MLLSNLTVNNLHFLYDIIVVIVFAFTIYLLPFTAEDDSAVRIKNSVVLYLYIHV